MIQIRRKKRKIKISQNPSRIVDIQIQIQRKKRKRIKKNKIYNAVKIYNILKAKKMSDSTYYKQMVQNKKSFIKTYLIGSFLVGLIASITLIFDNIALQHHTGDITRRSLQNPFLNGNITCKYDYQCSTGSYCHNVGFCMCSTCHTTSSGLLVPTENNPCNTQSQSIVLIFLMAFFFGCCGIDHFIVSGCIGVGACVGFIKLITFGGLTIWALVDWILIAANTQQYNYGYGFTGNHSVCSVWQ